MISNNYKIQTVKIYQMKKVQIIKIKKIRLTLNNYKKK